MLDHPLLADSSADLGDLFRHDNLFDRTTLTLLHLYVSDNARMRRHNCTRLIFARYATYSGGHPAARRRNATRSRFSRRSDWLVPPACATGMVRCMVCIPLNPRNPYIRTDALTLTVII